MHTRSIVAVTLILSSFPAKADTYAEMAQFAQSICGDIPSGSLTRTNIQSKVQANAALLAKIISGSGEVSDQKQQEIYQGVPFDKLPDKIPTVSMCKIELIKTMLTAKKKVSADDAPKVVCAQQGSIAAGRDASGNTVNYNGGLPAGVGSVKCADTTTKYRSLLQPR
jgi:hypothetical protein